MASDEYTDVITRDPAGNHRFCQYLTFILNNEIYGISINSVKEVIEYGSVTTVPLMPKFVKGVLNLRGDVVPVVDLSIRFGDHPTLIHKRSCIAILDVAFEQKNTVIGVVVDAVNDVVELQDNQIKEPPEFGARIQAHFIHGVAHIDDHFVIILEPDRVLSIKEMAMIIEHHHSADSQENSHV